jgi:CheY-like chemotaxis protein
MTRRYGGTGLGLAITKRLVELMGGSVGFRSRLGEGSLFWFTLPVAKGMADVVAAESTVVDAEVLIRQRFPGARVLVVDDEPINREVAANVLEGAGLVVDTAEDGREAIAKLTESSSYAAILMDMQMPDINGLEATRQIRRLPGGTGIPIIAMTANAFNEDRELCREAGMNDFLPKPFSPSTLYTMLLRWLENPPRA